MGRAGLRSAGDTNLIWYSFDIHNILCLAAPRDVFYHVYVCWRLCVLCNNILATPSAYTDMETDTLYSFTDISPGYFEHNCRQLHPICWSLTLRKCHGWCVICVICVIVAFLPEPSSQLIIYLMQKSRALIWIRGPSPVARVDATHICLCILPLTVHLILGLISILFNNKSYCPIRICSTLCIIPRLSSWQANDRDQTLKNFLGFIVAYNEHKV